MKKVKYIFLMISITILTSSCNMSDINIDAEKGFATINIKKDQIAYIGGEWEYYPGKTFNTISEIPKHKQYRKIPDRLKNEEFGTYHLKINNKNKENRYIIIDSYYVISSIYVNNILKYQIKKRSEKRIFYKFKNSMITIEIPPENKEIHVIIAAGKEIENTGGILQGIKITSKNGVIRLNQKRFSVNISLFLILSLICLNLIIMLIFLNKRKIALLVLLQYLTVVIKNTAQSDIFKNLEIGIGIGPEQQIKLIFIGIVISLIIWSMMLKEYNSKIFSDKTLKHIKFIAALSLLAIIVMEIETVVKVMNFYWIFLTIFWLISVIVFYKGRKKEKNKIYLMLIVACTLYATVISEQMIYMGIFISDLRNTNIGFILVFMAFSISVLSVNRKNFNIVRSQSRELIKQKMTVKELRREIEKTIDIKDEFLERTSHEMKSPISGIIGMADSLIEGEAGHLSQSAINQIGIIGYSARRLNNMIGNVIEASKIKLNEVTVDKKAVNIAGVVEVVKNLSEKELRKIDAELTIKISEKTTVKGDEYKINQIFINLIENAIRHSQCNKIFILEKEISESFVEIVVRDNGIGIENGFLDGLFEKNEKNEDNKVNGSGLGLYISRSLCRLQGGELTVEEQIGKSGTGLIVKLPKSKETAEKPLAQTMIEKNLKILEASENQEENKENRSLFEIWILDDDQLNLEIAKKILKKYETRVFEDPQELMEEIKYRKPNLIVLDIMMPRISGFDVCKEIRMLYDKQELPIIFLTSVSKTDDIVKGFEVGGNDFIIKPIDMNVLKVRVKSQLMISLLLRRLINLRGYSNRISEFRNVKDMINAIYNLLLAEGIVEDIAIFELGRQIKRNKKGKIGLKKLYNNEKEQISNEISLTEYDGKTFAIIDFGGISDFLMMMEFRFKPESHDIEYLKSAIDQIRATKRNITNIVENTKTMEEVNKIRNIIERIRYIRIDGNYCKVYSKADNSEKIKETMLKLSLSAIRLYLGDSDLIQVQRGCMVNKNYIESWDKKSRELKIDGETIKTGKTFINYVSDTVEETVKTAN